MAGVLLAVLAPGAGAQEPPRRPPIVGIAYVTVLASDMSAADDFYRGTLGLTREASGKVPEERYYLSGRQWIEVLPSGSTTPPNRVARIAFETPDVEAMRRYLEARDVPLVRGVVVDAGGRRSLRVRDPLGLEVEFVQPPAHSPAADAAEQPVGRRLIHAGFVVRDQTAADAFYRDILGFRPYWQGGMQEERTDWVDLQVPEGTDWVEYMLNIAPDAASRVLGIMNHMAIGVSSMEAAVETLRAHGWRDTERPQVGRDGKWQLNLYDPDLTRVEVMEFEPVEPPCCSEYTAPHPH